VLLGFTNRASWCLSKSDIYVASISGFITMVSPKHHIKGWLSRCCYELGFTMTSYLLYQIISNSF
jgi:hypothetical protein